MLTLRIIVVIVCLMFTILVCKQISKGRLLLRYSLLWFTLAGVTIVFAIFPEPVFTLSHFFGFNTPSNFIFFIALFFLLSISLSLSVALSRQALRTKNLIQNLAILDKEFEDISLKTAASTKREPKIDESPLDL